MSKGKFRKWRNLGERGERRKFILPIVKILSLVLGLMITSFVFVGCGNGIPVEEREALRVINTIESGIREKNKSKILSVMAGEILVTNYYYGSGEPKVLDSEEYLDEIMIEINLLQEYRLRNKEVNISGDEAYYTAQGYYKADFFGTPMEKEWEVAKKAKLIDGEWVLKETTLFTPPLIY